MDDLPKRKKKDDGYRKKYLIQSTPQRRKSFQKNNFFHSRCGVFLFSKTASPLDSG